MTFLIALIDSYASYTKSANLIKDPSPSRKQILAAPVKPGLSAKVSPAASKTIVQKNSLLISAKEASGVTNDKRTDLPSTNPSSKKFQLFSNKEKIDNKQKMESAEKKKKEEKIRAKAEKEAKKVSECFWMYFEMYFV